MPFVDILSSGDYVSLWYTTNSPYNNVGSFDWTKPTIILLHPLYLDSTWLITQFEDPRLDSNYNMIAFDMRVCGQSMSRPSAVHDSWVEAADLARAHQTLHLPKCHIFAVETLSVNCALRFAILFPEFCSSLTLCNAPPPTELKWAFAGIDELTQSWSYAVDLETYENAGKEAAHFVVGADVDPDLQDELIMFWEKTIPPTRRLRLVEATNVIMNRAPLKGKDLARITQPVLIIQGEKSPLWPVKYAEQLVESLVNAQPIRGDDGFEVKKHSAELYVVKGATGSLTLMSSTASIVNRVFSQFLSDIRCITGPDSLPPPTPITRMKEALSMLAEITGDASIANRPPLSSLSFSCLCPETRKTQMETLKLYAKDLDKAFSPLDAYGRPFRRFSDRNKDHWFESVRNGLSCADSDMIKEHLVRRQNEQSAKANLDEPQTQLTLPKIPSTESVSTQSSEESKSRRPTVSTNPVSDRRVVKGASGHLASPNAVAMHLSRLKATSPAAQLSRLHIQTK